MLLHACKRVSEAVLLVTATKNEPPQYTVLAVPGCSRLDALAENSIDDLKFLPSGGAACMMSHRSRMHQCTVWFLAVSYASRVWRVPSY